MIFINKESKWFFFFFLDYVLGKSKSNRIPTVFDYLIFLVTVGFTFISIKYMKQFSDFFPPCIYLEHKLVSRTMFLYVKL